eukprot:7828359-Karenia_brevis.AAC.1
MALMRMRCDVKVMRDACVSHVISREHEWACDDQCGACECDDLWEWGNVNVSDLLTKGDLVEQSTLFVSDGELATLDHDAHSNRLGVFLAT